MVIKIFALKNFKINIHQNVSRAFNILHYEYYCASHQTTPFQKPVPHRYTIICNYYTIICL